MFCRKEKMIYTEICWQPEKSRIYLGSPSICRAPDGSLIAAHDYFRGKSYHGVNPNQISSLTRIYRSEDDGQTWENISHFENSFWGTLFTVQGKLWMMSCSHEYGDVLLRCSEDNGWTWSIPFSPEDGLLLKVGPEPDRENWHFSATPVCVFNGRIYKGLEDFRSDRAWNPASFAAGILSAPVDCDLLKAENWTVSNMLMFDREQANRVSPGCAYERSGWMEGNPVPLPDNSGIVNITRLQITNVNSAGMIRVYDDGSRVEFDPSTDIIAFPGGGIGKFTVRKDPVTGFYFTLSNPYRKLANIYSGRSILSLSCSADLRNWYLLSDIYTDETGQEEEISVKQTGFQYADWQFDGDDLIAVVRVSYRGAHTYHDSNRIWFRRIRNFRRFLPEGGVFKQSPNVF